MQTRCALAAFLFILTLPPPSHASAQIRAQSTTGRARMELSFDHGFGPSSEGDVLELGMDLRVYAPEGVGAIVRTGVATQLMNIAYATDLGAVHRFDLFADDRVGLQLAWAGGMTVAYGPFDRGDVPGLGGFAALNLDLRSRGMFFGVGASGHALAVLGPEDDPIDGNARRAPLLSLVPFLRIGGEWGL